MRAFAGFVFVSLLLGSNAYIIETTPLLPVYLAVHFDYGGLPTSWMSRTDYQSFMLLFAGLLPVAMVAAMAGVPRLVSSGHINIPDRDYWLAPERLEATLGFFIGHAFWLGSLITAFLAGVHYAILHAHSTVPPHLPAEQFVGLLAAFVIGLVVWILTLMLHFAGAAA